MRQRTTSNQSNPSLFSHLLVLLVVLLVFVALERKAIDLAYEIRPYFVPREPSSFYVNIFLAILLGTTFMC
jgi:uncharacterized BrkB/YihY/UPF0761 family membrane protein